MTLKSMILKCEWRGLKWPGILRKAFKFSFKAVRFKETHFRWSSWVWLRSFTRLSRSSIEWERRPTMPLLLYITRYDHFDFDVVDDKAGGKSFCAQVAAVKESLERKQRRLTSLLARSKLRRYRRHNHHNCRHLQHNHHHYLHNYYIYNNLTVFHWHQLQLSLVWIIGH